MNEKLTDFLEEFKKETKENKRSYITFDNGFIASGVLIKPRDHILDEINTIAIRITTQINDNDFKVVKWDCTKRELEFLIHCLKSTYDKC